MMPSLWASVRIDSVPDGDQSSKLDWYDLEHSTTVGKSMGLEERLITSVWGQLVVGEGGGGGDGLPTTNIV